MDNGGNRTALNETEAVLTSMAVLMDNSMAVQCSDGKHVHEGNNYRSNGYKKHIHIIRLPLVPDWQIDQLITVQLRFIL